MTILLVVMICLFPVWPDFTKLIIFYISLVTLYFLVGLLFIRLIVWLVFRIFGVEFWLFPNLNADVGPIESFVPLYSFDKTEDGWVEYLGRFIALLITFYIIYLLYTD